MPHRPTIGIMTDHNPGNLEKFGGDEAHHFINARYGWAVERAGGVPWLLPSPLDSALAHIYVSRIDGLLLTGCGRHLDPAAYGESPRHELALMAPAKQQFEFALIQAALQRGIPVFGICGGMQSINVVLGGTLIQRIEAEVATPLAHMQTSKATHTVHDVSVAPGTLLYRITGARALATNSSHTQAVGRLAQGLVANAHTSDGVMEGFEGTNSWLLAVQWHPEYLFATHPPQAELFLAFVTACRKGTWV